MLYTITAERLQALLYADTLLDQLSAMDVDRLDPRGFPILIVEMC